MTKVRTMVYSTVKVQLSKVQVSGYVYFVTEVRTMAYSIKDLELDYLKRIGGFTTNQITRCV